MGAKNSWSKAVLELKTAIPKPHRECTQVFRRALVKPF
jgi:hypothetical protein